MVLWLYIGSCAVWLLREKIWLATRTSELAKFNPGPGVRRQTVWGAYVAVTAALLTSCTSGTSGDPSATTETGVASTDAGAGDVPALPEGWSAAERVPAEASCASDGDDEELEKPVELSVQRQDGQIGLVVSGIAFGCSSNITAYVLADEDKTKVLLLAESNVEGEIARCACLYHVRVELMSGDGGVQLFSGRNAALQGTWVP